MVPVRSRGQCAANARQPPQDETLPPVARYGVPFFWLVDPEGQTIEAFALQPEGYSPAGRAFGTDPTSLPPFPDLAIVPATLWP